MHCFMTQRPFNYEESLPTVAGSSREFYSLSLPRDAVHWVHDISTFNDCVRSLSEVKFVYTFNNTNMLFHTC